MNKLDINKLHIEYYHKSKQYYRVDKKQKGMINWSYNWKYKPISHKTAMNWIKKGAKLWEYNSEYDDYRGYDK